MEKNDIIPLKITGMASSGSGVGHADDGLTVFVPLSAVGDTLDCRIVKVTKTHAFGQIKEIITRSPDRIQEPGCSVFGKCGGCAFRHITYEAELRYKRQRVRDALTRIGGIDIEPDPVVACGSPDGYRNKAQYPVAPGTDHPMIGFYAPRSHRIIEQHNCALQPPVFGDIVRIVYHWMEKERVEPYDEASHTGLLRHIYIRQGAATGNIMVCLVCTSGNVPAADRLVTELRKHVPALSSLMVNINREDTNVVLGNNEFVLWGENHIVDRLCGMRFRLSPRSFYQVNHRQAGQLYSIAAKKADLTGRETILDMYCGTGTIGLSMAQHAKKVIGADIVEAAIADAVKNAEENGVDNAEFMCADAYEAAEALRLAGVSPDVVILDPPRKGCSPPVIASIAAMSPLRVVYISCDPATLARDLAVFSRAGYETVCVTPVDMFPRTPHVECVALLTR